MPESAEVKLISEYLSHKLLDKTVVDIQISEFFSKKIPKGLEIFKLSLPLQCSKIETKGKFISANFVNHRTHICFLNNLGMSGNWTTDDKKHNHVTFILQDGSKVHYNDPRKFGNLNFLTHGELFKKLETVGLDILSEFIRTGYYNTGALVYQFRKRNKDNICKILMDQTILSGIGNYIKAEVLYRCKISPLRTVKELTDKQINDIILDSSQVAYEAYRDGGNSFKSFSVNGEKGSYIQNMKCYRRVKDDEGRKIIKILTKDGRNTYYCPEIQK